MKIALDGPAGAGKSTVAKELARKLNYTYINTGALYRAYTLKTLQENIDLDNLQMLTNSLENTTIDIVGEDVYLDGENVSGKIYNPTIDKNISRVADNKTVRAYLKIIQNDLICKNENIIMEGRDIATIILPDADYKFFITAGVEVRAKRRFEQNEQKGIKSDYDEILKDIIKRDEDDKKREIAPLVILPESIVIDSSNITPQQTVEEILCIMKK
ncbi:MAG: (d)CMP kinase [Eubacteriaceae bacterium]|nr:(d)CMP kinase [Eubacteriaceae bacterium]